MVELDIAGLTQEVVKKVEDTCNRHIRDHCAVNVKVYKKGDPELDSSKTRGLPDDVAGDIRVIEMVRGSGGGGEAEELIDSNMCCGTHVSNLAHLQAIKLLHWEEKTKKSKTSTCLYFLVGGRVLNYLQECHDRERHLTSVLSIGPEDHVKVADKINKQAKSSTKKLQNILKEVAASDARRVKEEQLKYFCVHRPDADVDYINTLLRELNDPEVLVVAGVGEVKTGGQLAMAGPEPLLKELSPGIFATLDAKGGGKGSRINAKAPSFAKWAKVEKLLVERFAEQLKISETS